MRYFVSADGSARSLDEGIAMTGWPPGVRVRLRARVGIGALGVITAAAMVVAVPVGPVAAFEPADPSVPVVWTPPAVVNRTPTGSVPDAAWQPSSTQTGGVGASAAAPAATAAAAGSLGVSPLAAGAGASGPGLGVLGFYGLETFGLNAIDGLQAQVNLATGNLVVHGTDLKINAPGLNVRLDRFYNSRATGSGTFGVNSVLSTGRDVGLQVGASSVTFIGPSGFTAVFTGTSTFTAPSGINAKLVRNSDGTFTLTYRKSGERLSFTAGGYLTADKDRNGVGLTFLYAGDRLASITDAAGRVTTFAYANGRPSHSWTPPGGRRRMTTTPPGT